MWGDSLRFLFCCIHVPFACASLLVYYLFHIFGFSRIFHSKKARTIWVHVNSWSGPSYCELRQFGWSEVCQQVNITQVIESWSITASNIPLLALWHEIIVADETEKPKGIWRNRKKGKERNPDICHAVGLQPDILDTISQRLHPSNLTLGLPFYFTVGDSFRNQVLDGLHSLTH